MAEPLPARRPGRVQRRLLALLVGVVATPVVLELGLQVASLFVGGGRAASEAECLVLCQGDSHTYGLWLPPNGSYPWQLEALLTERGATPAGVVNRGIPGKTSWQVLAEVPDDVERWSPAAVCLWIGVNDRTGRRPDVSGPAWWERLRTVRAARNLFDRFSPQRAEELPSEPVGEERETFDVSGKALTQLGVGDRRLDFEGRDGEMQHLLLHGGNPSVETYTTWIREDLVAAARHARSRGAVPILLSYPVDDPPRLEINRAIEAAAEEAGARFLDLRPHFERAAELQGWHPLLYGRGHPKQLGYSIIARLVYAELVDEELAPGPAPDPLELVRAFVPAEMEVLPWSEDGAVVGVEVRYTPGHRVQALFSDGLDAEGLEVTNAGAVRLLSEVGERFEDETRRVGLADGELFRDALRRTHRYMVTLDESGEARIRLRPELLDVTPLYAVVCALTPHEGVSKVSEPVVLRRP